MPPSTADTASLTLVLNMPPIVDRQELEQSFVLMQELLFNELGLICPKVAIQTSTDIPDNSFQLQINDVHLHPTTALEADEFWVNVPASLLDELGLTGRPSTNPNNGDEAAIMRGDGEAIAKWQSAGFDTRNPRGYIIFNAAAAIRAHASLLLSAELLEYYLLTLKETHPALIDTVLKQFDQTTLIQMLRARLDQQRSIKNLPGTLEDLLAQAVMDVIG